MRKHLIAALGLGLTLALLGACGSDDDSSDVSSDDTDQSDTGSDAGTEGSGEVVSTAETEFGEVLVDADGNSLYGFTEDVDGQPTCDDACADAWPPLLVDSADLPEGLDASVFSVVERSDGSFQLAAGDFPLYRFAGDSGEADTAGQGSGDVWFLAAPDGALVGLDGDGAEDGDDESGDAGYGY